jgi:hypothetical protein
MSQEHVTTDAAQPDETENVAIVKNFFADWAKRDASVLAA